MMSFKHHNIVELIAMCLDSPDGFPMMVLPLYPNGNLKTYLQKSRGFSPMVDRLPEVFLMKLIFHVLFIKKNECEIKSICTEFSHSALNVYVYCTYRVCHLALLLQCVWTLHKE